MTQLASALPRSDSARLPLVYVLAAGHSGSTLLGMVLGRNPEIATVGELKTVPTGLRLNQPCSCGVPMRECPFWIDVLERLQKAHVDVLQRGVEIHPAWDGTWMGRMMGCQVGSAWRNAVRSAAMNLIPAGRLKHRTIAEINRTAVRVLLEATGGSVFLDTSKDAARLRYLLEMQAFDVRVIHLVRDGRASAYSFIRKGIAARAAAKEWEFEQRQARRLCRALPAVPWLRIRYEDFCRNPPDEVGRMFEFMGVQDDSAFQDFRGWDCHVLGNRMRLSKATEIRLDEHWRHELRDPDRADVDAITGAFNRSYGYD